VISFTLRAFLPANRLGRHLLFWVGVGLYFWVPQLIYPDYLNTVGRYFFGFDYARSPYFLPLLFGYSLGVGMLYTYAFRAGVLPSLLAGRYGLSLGRFALLTVGICYLFRLLKALHMALLDPWLRHAPRQPLDPRHFQGLFINQVYINEYLTVLLVVASYKLLANWQKRQQEASQLAQAKIRTEIQLVKAQVNPRFLFHSLDQLQDLLDRHAPQAPAAVLALSQFLSYVLYESQAEQVPLARELAALRQYLALKQTRLGERLDVSFQLTGEVLHQRIAPLLLLPLLENALQHGLTTPDQAWLSVQVAVTDQAIKFSLANSVDPNQAPTFVAGRGLTALRQRLATQYAGRSDLKLAPEEGIFVAVLTLQLAPLPAVLGPPVPAPVASSYLS